jgi:hypothetical protein
MQMWMAAIGYGFGQPSFPPPNPCAFSFNWIGLVTNTDGSIVLACADNFARGQD